MSPLRRTAVRGATALFFFTPAARASDDPYSADRLGPFKAYAIWTTAQLIPSPLLVIGENHVGGGLRWQVTPLLYSFGITEKPIRAFLVAPIARHSGSIEVHASPEWACCPPGNAHAWLLRAGARVYLPIVERGERLSFSLGGSYHFDGDRGGVAGDAGIYSFSGLFGLNVTVSPWLDRREVVTAFTIRYF